MHITLFISLLSYLNDFLRVTTIIISFKNCIFEDKITKMQIYQNCTKFKSTKIHLGCGIPYPTRFSKYGKFFTYTWLVYTQIMKQYSETLNLLMYLRGRLINEHWLLHWFKLNIAVFWILHWLPLYITLHWTLDRMLDSGLYIGLHRILHCNGYYSALAIALQCTLDMEWV